MMYLGRIQRSAKRGRMRKVAFALVFALSVLGMIPSVGSAGVINPAETERADDLRTENMEKIKSVIEREEVATRLADYGLTPEEVETRMESLTDEQVSELAANLDDLSSGEGPLELALTIILVILIVWLILRILDMDAELVES